MIVPRSHIKALYDYWPVVESLALKSCKIPYLESDILISDALRHSGQNRLEADECIRQMTSKGILLAVGNSGEYQLHGPTRDFVLSLIQEHELGLAEVIRVEVEEMQRLGEEIQTALDSKDISAIQPPIARLGNRIQSVSRQLLHDQQAILNIADRAKTLPAGTPLALRYKEVLESFDRYVEPMVQLLQRDQTGFAALTEIIEDQLLQAQHLCDTVGALVSERRRIGATAFALRTLRAEARERLEVCRETLLPLREEYLKNTGIAVAVARLLSIARKKGVKKILSDNRLGLGGPSRVQRLIPGRFTRSYMADLIGFVPEAVSFPEAPEKPPRQESRLRFTDVTYRLERCLPVENLLTWLLSEFPYQSEKQILRLYHDLVREYPEQATFRSEELKMILSQHALWLYPHQIQSQSISQTLERQS